MRAVLILVHATRPEAAQVAVEFALAVQAEGIEICALDADATVLKSAGLEQVRSVTSAPPDSELALVFGGDGTILRAAEACRGTQVPVLGVNLGHVGFLAESDAEDLGQVVRGVIDQTYTVEERLTVDVSVTVGGEVVATNWALNEASVEKAAHERMLELVVEIDDRPVSRWGCDGVVCATPTGSTAYNFSAGGPIVWPEVAALLMVPISAHALFARPMVVSPDSTLAIEVVGEFSTGVLWCDGRRAAELPVGARVEVTKGVDPVRLARFGNSPFADRLVRKFDLPVAGWRGAAERRNGAR
jgi:NAD+ kinase